MLLLRRLIDTASILDADRSDYDENDVARRVLDHLRFLDSASVAALRSDQLESLQSYAEMQRARAPFDVPAPWAATPREQSLRRYLACYGISSPPRLEHDRARATSLLVQALDRAVTEKPRPSLVYVWSTAPDEPSPAARPGGEKAPAARHDRTVGLHAARCRRSKVRRTRLARGGRCGGASDPHRS